MVRNGTQRGYQPKAGAGSPKSPPSNPPNQGTSGKKTSAKDRLSVSHYLSEIKGFKQEVAALEVKNRVLGEMYEKDTNAMLRVIEERNLTISNLEADVKRNFDVIDRLSRTLVWGKNT